MLVHIYDNDKPFVRFSYTKSYQKKHSDNDSNYVYTPDVNIFDLDYQVYRSEHPEDKDLILEKEKAYCNLWRSKRILFDYAICNHWDYFGTITLADRNFPRYELDNAYKHLSKYFNNYKNRKNPNFKYLCVPEMHKDRAWHFHLLCSGILSDDLLSFSTYSKPPYKIKKNYLDKGLDCYNFTAIEKRFGFNSFIRTYGEQEHIAKYMAKYIVKSFETFKRFNGVQIVRCSKGLNKPIDVYCWTFSPLTDIKPVVENDYCVVFEMPLHEFQSQYNIIHGCRLSFDHAKRT